MNFLRTANLAIRFLLELILLLAFGYWGFGAGESMPAKILLGIGIPLLAAAIWGRFLAPASTYRLKTPWLLIVEGGIFVLAIGALYTRGQAPWAWALGLTYLINRLLMSVWRQ